MPQGWEPGSLFTNNIPSPLVVAEGTLRLDRPEGQANGTLRTCGTSAISSDDRCLAVARCRRRGGAPDWVQPFLEADAEWTEGRAEGTHLGQHRRPEGGSPLTRRPSWPPPGRRPSISGWKAMDNPSGCGRSALPATGIGGRMMVWRARILGWALTQGRPSSALVLRPQSAPTKTDDFAVATPQQAAHLGRSGQLGRLPLLLLGGGPVPPDLEDRLQELGPCRGLRTPPRIRHDRNADPHRHPAARSRCLPPLPGVDWSCRPGRRAAARRPRPGRGPPPHAGCGRTRDEAGPEPFGFVWLGRLDDVINTGGLKVHPADLERILEPIVTLR